MAKHQTTPALAAGYAKTDLVPDGVLHLAGMFTRTPRIGERHRDPLMARALALRAGEQTVVLVVADLLCISEELHAAVVEALDGCESAEVFLAATHTHASFGGYFLAGAADAILGAPDQRIFAFLVDRLSGVARAALSDLAPAQAEAGAADVEGLVASRRQADGPHDDQVVLLRLERPDRRPIDLVAASGHPVLVSEHDASLVSGCYPGEVCRRLEQAGSDPLFLSAALGGVSILFPEFAMGLERHLELVTGLLLEGHQRAAAALAPVGDAPALDVELLRVPHGPHQSRLFSGLGPQGKLLDGLLAWPRRKFRQAYVAGMPLPDGVPLHLVRLGDFVLLGTPFDLGVSVLLGVRAAALGRGARVAMIASQVDAYAGYIHTSEVYRRQPEKGYRFLAYYENGLAVFGYDLGDDIVRTVDERLQRWASSTTTT